MNRISKSPDRYSFQKESYIKRQQEKGEEVREDYLDLFDQSIRRAEENEKDPNWAKNNLEYDLRTSELMCGKVRADKRYAQNLYAAMCNREFIKLAVVPILQDQRWSCSWRYAGGIVADMRQEGDYIDWYCSGIRDIDYDEDINKQWDERRYVSEGTVTEEIQNDLQQIGWAVLPEDSSPY